MELETRRLILRPFETTDFADVHAYAGVLENSKFMWWAPNTEAATREFIASARATTLDPENRSHDLALVDRASGQVIGSCGVRESRRLHHEFELGYILHRDYWRRGYVFEAARRVCEFAFADLGGHRIYATIDPENIASRGLIEKLGFTKEGLLRKDMSIRGEWRDSLLFSLLEEEWGSAG